jgi:hypothetical protein
VWFAHILFIFMYDLFNNTDDEEEEAAIRKLILKCSEVMECLDTYHHFLSGIPNVPKSLIRNLWELSNFTSNLTER